MINVAIVGYGGFGREVNLILQQLIKLDFEYNFIGFFDDADKADQLGKLYLGSIADLVNINEDVSVVVAIGNSKTRNRIANKLAQNERIKFLPVVSPNAIFNDTLEVGEGSIICAGANFTTNIKIGKHVVVNLNATIGHDCVLSDGSSVMPGANLSGDVTLHKNAFIGSGATVLNGLTVGEGAVLGAGAVLTKNLAAGKTAVGIPAKELVL